MNKTKKRDTTMQTKIYSILILFVLSISGIYGQSVANPAPGYNSTVGGALSAGFFTNKDAVFWGLGMDYSRLISENWVVSLGFGFDQEISKEKEMSEVIVNTLSPSLAFGYILSPKFVLGLGVGKGLLDDDNSSGNMKYNKNGGWTAGLLGVYTIYQKKQHGFDITAGIEQALGNSDLDFTLELGYGYSF